MTINLTLTDSDLEFLLDANDPNREVWENIGELTPKDVQYMLEDILEAWIRRWG